MSAQINESLNEPWVWESESRGARKGSSGASETEGSGHSMHSKRVRRKNVGSIEAARPKDSPARRLLY